MKVDVRLKKGIELFNREEFYECHEVIEGLWLATQDEYKDLYKGIIQAAVSLHHLKRGNVRGARKLYHTSKKYLKGYQPRVLGLDIKKLTQNLEECFERNSKYMPKIAWKEES